MIVGSGYVGLVSGACFAELGHDVVCVDRDHDKIAALRAGHVPIFEPGLDQLIAHNHAAGRMRFETAIELAGSGVEAVFIAVGTPPKASDGSADLSAVYSVSAEVAASAREDLVLVTKSTVPVGTGDEIEAIIRRVDPRATISVASNPEFLREGQAIDDFLNPDRIVVGVEDGMSQATLARLYAPLTNKGAPLLAMRRRAAELVKYASNCFLATKISFINEMADLCESVDVDVLDISAGMGLDRRIGSAFLQPGPGYGGSCFPKDCNALISTARAREISLSVVESAIDSNRNRQHLLAGKILKTLGSDLRGKTVAVLGLTFKAETDDIRETPSIPIIRALRAAGARVTAYDPQAAATVAKLLPDVTYARSALDCCADADCVVVATEWREFRELDARLVAKAAKGRVIHDLRNILDRDAFAEAGFTVYGVGRPARRDGRAASRQRSELTLEPAA